VPLVSNIRCPQRRKSRSVTIFSRVMAICLTVLIKLFRFMSIY
jgi:hypothetical protein